MITPLSILSEIATDQWGLLTRAQALEAGVPLRTLKRLAASGVITRVALGIYHLAGAPMPDHIDLRAAWLQLASAVPAWQRTPEQGVVSHRSAAGLFGLGDLVEERHEFTLTNRRQTRRDDVRLHVRRISPEDWSTVRGLPVTRPARTVHDLLSDGEEPAAVAHVIADALHGGHETNQRFAAALAQAAIRLGFRRNDGAAVLRWLLDLIGETRTP